METTTETPKTDVQVFYRPRELDAAEWTLRTTGLDGSVTASVAVRQIVECSCAAIVFALQTREEYRRKGLARSLLLRIEQLARDNTIALLMATVKTDNLASAGLFESLGYTRARVWHNPRTNHDLILFVKTL